MQPLIYLASLSPRRAELLTQIGVHHQVVRVEVDETLRASETPEAYVLRLALEKARAGKAAIGGATSLLVLAADTAVVVDDEIMGKPTGREDALRMMARLSGRGHQVLTGVALAGGKEEYRLSVSHVTFRTVSEAEARVYWESGEPTDKAGGYAVQGLGAAFVSRLEGSFSGVMGLPLFETAELLQAADMPLIRDQR